MKNAREKKEQIKVVQDPADPVSVEILATSIRDISKAMSQVNTAGLNRRALVTLLKEATKLSARDIEFVLNALSRLEELYTIRKPTRSK